MTSLVGECEIDLIVLQRKAAEPARNPINVTPRVKGAQLSPHPCGFSPPSVYTFQVNTRTNLMRQRDCFEINEENGSISCNFF